MDVFEWQKRFKARLIERGYTDEEAQDAADISTPDDLSLDPEMAADDEISYAAEED